MLRRFGHDHKVPGAPGTQVAAAAHGSAERMTTPHTTGPAPSAQRREPTQTGQVPVTEERGLGPPGGSGGSLPRVSTADVGTVVTRHGIQTVEPLIRPYLRHTPAITVDRADFALPPGPLVLKLEQLQHGGSFKARGAFANLLLRDMPAAGVVAASGGNHGAAVAFAARALGIPARIYVPHVSSPAKIARIRGYGADLVVAGDTYSDALAASQEWTAGSGALPIHAYDQVETMLGAGTLGMELACEAPDATQVLASVGGGGLLAGVAAWYADGAQVVGVEPEGAPTLTKALRGWTPRGRRGRQRGGRFAGAPERWRANVVPPGPSAMFATSSSSPMRPSFTRKTCFGRSCGWRPKPGGVAALAAILSHRFEPEPRARRGCRHQRSEHDRGRLRLGGHLGLAARRGAPRTSTAGRGVVLAPRPVS